MARRQHSWCATSHPYRGMGYRIGRAFRRGHGSERLNTDAGVYGGSGVGNHGSVVAEAEAESHGFHTASLVVTLPPLDPRWSSFRRDSRPPGAGTGLAARGFGCYDKILPSASVRGRARSPDAINRASGFGRPQPPALQLLLPEGRMTNRCARSRVGGIVCARPIGSGWDGAYLLRHTGRAWPFPDPASRCQAHGCARSEPSWWIPNVPFLWAHGALERAAVARGGDL